MLKPTITLRIASTQFGYLKTTYCLLDLLELYAVKVEYQCRSGYCGACRLKLLKGEVAYRQPPLALINKGEILPCCCIPLTDIELDI